MPFPYDPEPADRLFAKHGFINREEYVKRHANSMINGEIEGCLIRGWRCVVCGQTEPECLARNPFRPYPMGTVDMREVKPETENAEKA